MIQVGELINSKRISYSKRSSISDKFGSNFFKHIQRMSYAKLQFLIWTNSKSRTKIIIKKIKESVVALIF